MGKEFVKAVITGNPDAKSIVALGGTPGNPLSATWQECAEKEAAEHPGVKIVGKFDTNWTQEGTFNAVSAALSQFGKVDGYIYEYADGFRGAVRAYDTAKKPPDFVAALRTRRAGSLLRPERPPTTINSRSIIRRGRTFSRGLR